MILFVTKGKADDASSRVRILNYLPYLKNDGYKFCVVPYRFRIKGSLAERVINTFHKYTLWIRMMYCLLIKSPSIVVIQKIVVNRYVLSRLKKKVRRLVFDMDDAIYLDNQGRVIPDFAAYLSNFDEVITCSCQYKEQYQIKKSRIIPSCVEVRKDQVRPKSTNHVLCWIGSPYTEKYLYPVKSQLISLLEEYPDLCLEFVGCKDFNIDHERFVKKVWSIQQEEQTLRKASIGIMPIDKDTYSKYKCGYKLLLYKAHMVLAIGTEWGANTEIIAHGDDGLLVKETGDWFRTIGQALDNQAWSMQLAEAGHQQVASNYSYQNNYQEWRNTIIGA